MIFMNRRACGWPAAPARPAAPIPSRSDARRTPTRPACRPSPLSQPPARRRVGPCAVGARIGAPGRHRGGGAAWRAGLGLLAAAAPLLRPRPLPHRLHRPARRRRKPAARRDHRQHHGAPARPTCGACATHLGIARWLVVGGSWGATLALAHALDDPDAVSALLLRATFLARPADIASFFDGAAFSDDLAGADTRTVLDALAARLQHPDAARAARLRAGLVASRAAMVEPDAARRGADTGRHRCPGRPLSRAGALHAPRLLGAAAAAAGALRRLAGAADAAAARQRGSHLPARRCAGVARPAAARAAARGGRRRPRSRRIRRWSTPWCARSTPSPRTARSTRQLAARAARWHDEPAPQDPADRRAADAAVHRRGADAAVPRLQGVGQRGGRRRQPRGSATAQPHRVGGRPRRARRRCSASCRAWGASAPTR